MQYTASSFEVDEVSAGKRLDVFLASESIGLTRSYIQKLIINGLVSVNGGPAKPSYRVKEGDLVILQVPPPEGLELRPEPIPLDIYYEDADVVVVNKPRGMVVHPGAGNFSGTLVNALLYHCRDLSGINGTLRPGIVHRLDKFTSGLLVVAKNDASHLELARQLKERRVKRHYIALVYGCPKTQSGTVDVPIGRDPKNRKKMAVVFKNSRRAVTHYRVIEYFDKYTLLEVRLETGRTHQIRVHMSYIGHPVVGDDRYGPSKPCLGLRGQFLHAASLGFYHPKSLVYMEFEAPLPEELAAVLSRLKSLSHN